jgi:hypothetical protein
MSAVISQAVAIGRQVAAQYRPDVYEVRRTTTVDDGEGGETPTTITVESGGCVLTAGATRPAEIAIADQAGSTTPYVARNLPYNTVLTAEDELRINGRIFQVLGVLRAEATNVAVTAVCQERT